MHGLVPIVEVVTGELSRTRDQAGLRELPGLPGRYCLGDAGSGDQRERALPRRGVERRGDPQAPPRELGTTAPGHQPRLLAVAAQQALDVARDVERGVRIRRIDCERGDQRIHTPIARGRRLARIAEDREPQQLLDQALEVRRGLQRGGGSRLGHLRAE